MPNYSTSESRNISTGLVANWRNDWRGLATYTWSQAVVTQEGMVADTTALTNNAMRQSDVLLAHICAENELVKVRLSRQMPGVGETNVPCEQAGRSFSVTVGVLPTPNPSFRRIDAQVMDGTSPVLRLSTVVGSH